MGASDSDVASYTSSPFNIDTWYLIEGVFDNSNSGYITVRCAEVSGGSLVNWTTLIDNSGPHDFDSGDSEMSMYLKGQGYDPLQNYTDTYIAHPFVMDDAGGPYNMLGGHRTGFWKPQKASAVPDFTKTGGSGGDNLDSNTWDKAGDSGSFTYAGYDPG